MYPSRRVWHSIYNDRHPSRKWPSTAISMVLVFILMLLGYLNTGDSDMVSNSILTDGNDPSSTTATTTNNGKPKRWTGGERKAYATTTSDDGQEAPTDNAGNEDAAATTFIARVVPAYPLSDDALSQDVPGDRNRYDQGSNNNNFLATGIDASTSGSIQNREEFTVRNNNRISGQYSVTGNDKQQTVNNNPALTASASTATPKDAANRNYRNNNRNNVTRNKESFTRNRTGNEETNDIAGQRGTRNPKAKTKVSKPAEISIAKSNSEDESLAANDFSGLNSRQPASTDAKTVADQQKNPATDAPALLSSLKKTGLSDEEKSWIEDFALHNKPRRKKWKDVLAMEFYATPSVSYRSLGNNIKEPSAAPFANNAVSNYASHKPGLGLEAGVGIAYAFAKKLRFKAGLQFNYTNFGVNAGESSHPYLVSLLMNDPATGYTYSAARSTNLSNNNPAASRSVTMRNKTYQVSIPVGLSFKLAGNKTVEWFAGASVQPSLILGGDAYLLSADFKNYVSEPNAIRRWNFNTGFETYVNYKIGNTVSLQAGPQFRYQLQSTYKKEYTTSEKLYNVGLKIGLVKQF